MAGVQRQKDSKGKWRYRIQFYDTTGKRHSVWLGRVSNHHANEVASHIENLVDAAKHGSTIAAKTLAWLQDEAPDKLIECLSNADLCNSRQRGTLGEFVQAYIESREDASENTVRNFSNSRQKLVDYLGSEKLIHDITTGEADDWRQWLVNQKYSDATISKAVKHAKHFLLMAKRKGLVRSNPFQHLKAGGEENKSRTHFIEQHIIDRAIEVAPDTQWKLIIALARYGGLRCPSEVLALTWADLDWEAGRIVVTSPKTKKHGKAYRIMPIFPELRVLLERAFEEAEEGALHVITKYRKPNANLRTQFERILKRAGIKPWQRLFQNLRASRETELANEYPLHVVTAWLGNTETVASKHYLQVTDAHFEQAQRVKTGATASQMVPKPAPRDPAAIRTDSQETRKPSELTAQTVDVPMVTETDLVPPRGSEQTAKSPGNRRVCVRSGTESGTVAAHNAPIDPDLQTIIHRRPYLPDAVRAKVVALVRPADELPPRS